MSRWNDTARALVSSAIRAPSSHNTQPWIFRILPGAIDLFADRTRALPVNDPDDRELVISCGCALMNLRAAAASEGLAARVEPWPDAADPDHLARATFTATASGLPETELAQFIDSRQTWRKRFLPDEIPSAVVHRLVEAAASEGAEFHPLITETVREQAAMLVAEGDRALWSDPRWRRELAAWMHPRRRGDGLAIPALAVPIAQAVVRTFDMGSGVAARDRELADASPLLAVLSTAHDTPRDWLAAGQALERVLLVGRSAGLQASYLNQPVQVAALRTAVAGLIKAGHPQVLLRMGQAAGAVRRTARRPVGEVIEPTA